MNAGQHDGATASNGPDPSLPGSWFQDLAESAGDVFFRVRTAPDLALEFISDDAVTQLGHSATELLASPELFIKAVDPRDAASLADFLSWPPGEQGLHELRWRHPDGQVTATQAWIRSREREDGSTVLEGTSHDISDLRSAEQSTLLFEERYRLMAESANIVLWTMGLDGSITYVSPTVTQMRGLTVEEAMNQPLEEILTPDSQRISRDYYARLYEEMAAGRVPEPFRCEQEYYRKDGSTIWTEVEVIPYLGPDGTITELLGITRDISDRKQIRDDLVSSRDQLAAANTALANANELLQRLAVTDSLTGLWNRRQGEQILNADLAEARRYKTTMSLLLMDIDHFKAINDTHGHQMGDQVLIALTRRLSSNLRTSDALCRWGGEEFVVLTRHCGIVEATALAEKMCALVAAEPFGDAGTVSISVGVAELQPEDDLSSWLSRADRALYAAKSAGRNTARASA